MEKPKNTISEFNNYPFNTGLICSRCNKEIILHNKNETVIFEGSWDSDKGAQYCSNCQ
jgi:hypothetical protein